MKLAAEFATFMNIWRFAKQFIIPCFSWRFPRDSCFRNVLSEKRKINEIAPSKTEYLVVIIHIVVHARVCIPDFSFGMCHCMWGISHWFEFASEQLSRVFYRHLDIALLAFLSALALIGLEYFSAH